MKTTARPLLDTLALAARRLVPLVPLAALVACSATPYKPDELAEEKQYRTGSNLPVRDRNAPGSGVVTVDPASVQGQMNRSVPPPSGGSR